MKNLINWVKQTFEDLRGKPSSRKITGFWITVLTTYTVVWYQYLIFGFASGKWQVNEYTVTILDANYALILLLLSALLLLFGVITVEALVSLVRGNKTNVIINEKTESKKETVTENVTAPSPPNEEGKI